MKHADIKEEKKTKEKWSVANYENQRDLCPFGYDAGETMGKILVFTIPMLLGNIAQQLYNTVDSIVVGRYVGDNALAAVGSASPIMNLLLVLFVGISVGAGVMVSQYFGAKEREALSRTIETVSH